MVVREEVPESWILGQPIQSETKSQGFLFFSPSGSISLMLSYSYMLATDLHTNLDDLSSSLTQMIESVNALSLPSAPSESTGTNGEDAMAQIAQILSSHLESLQWIDGAVREVESKVTDVEKRVNDSGLSTPTQKSRGFGVNR